VKENIELKILELSRGTAKETVGRYQEKISDYKKKIEKYEQEKTEIQAKAKQLEEMRDEAQKHSKSFGMAIIFLQIAILLSSISGLLKKKPVWYGGLATGVIGLFFFMDGFLLML